MVLVMGWKQSEIALGDPLMTAVQTAVADAHLLDTARRGSVSSGFALFTRNHDSGTTLLLSPEAAEFLSRYPGRWEDCAGPGNLGWGGLYTEARSWEILGVRLESDG